MPTVSSLPARVALQAIKALIIGLGALALYKGLLSQAPFSSDAQVIGPDGKPFFTEDVTPMMHRGEYRVEAARAFMRAAIETEGPGRAAHLLEARAHLEDALELRPNDARAAAMLATVTADLGDIPATLDALRASWRAAPDAPQMAETRLAVVSRLRAAIPSALLDHARNDLTVLARWNGGRYRQVIRNDRYLRLLARQSGLETR